MTSFTVKVHLKPIFGSDQRIRKFKVNRNITYVELKVKIQQVFNTTNDVDNMKYKDEDGDLVQFSSDEELDVAFDENATNRKVTIFVEEKYMDDNYG